MSSEQPIQPRPDASNETWETTAQWAKAEASTRELSDEVERNARKEAEAAKRAADAAVVSFGLFMLVCDVDFNGRLTSISPPARPIAQPRRLKRLTTSNVTPV
jgi:hypothetical protein